MSDIFGKIFGKDKEHRDKTGKDKVSSLTEKGINPNNTIKWADFCKSCFISVNSLFGINIKLYIKCYFKQKNTIILL